MKEEHGLLSIYLFFIVKETIAIVNETTGINVDYLRTFE